MSVLRLENVRKTFDDRLEVLRDISLTIEEGEVVAIIGPSGGGKSTLLRCMIDLEEITGGSIYVGEEPLVRDGKYCGRADRARLTSEMGMVFQSFNLFHCQIRKLCNFFIRNKRGSSIITNKKNIEQSRLLQLIIFLIKSICFNRKVCIVFN